MMLTTGYIYCFSNKLMPGMLKIGMTRRNPLIRLKEANRPDTWRPPIKYEIEFAKYVENPLKKEQLIHKILERYNKRINLDREFFQTTIEEIKDIFELVEGHWWKHENEPPVITNTIQPVKNNTLCTEIICKKSADFIPIETKTITKNGIKIYCYKRTLLHYK